MLPTLVEGTLHSLNSLPNNHPSFIELEESDNVVEKYNEGIRSVCNILTKDKVDQEDALRGLLHITSVRTKTVIVKIMASQIMLSRTEF